MVQTYLDTFGQALELWTDQRHLTRDEVRAVFMFTKHIVNVMSSVNAEYLGHSFKASTPLNLLVVKAVVDGVRRVAFVSGSDATDCMRIFIKQLENDVVQWREDLFA
jgi:hypothetical protein